MNCIGRVFAYMSDRPTAGTSWLTAEFKAPPVFIQSIMCYRTIWYIVSNVWAEPAVFTYITAEFKAPPVFIQSIMCYRTVWYIVSNVWAEPAVFNS